MTFHLPAALLMRLVGFKNPARIKWKISWQDQTIISITHQREISPETWDHIGGKLREFFLGVRKSWNLPKGKTAVPPSGHGLCKTNTMREGAQRRTPLRARQDEAPSRTSSVVSGPSTATPSAWAPATSVRAWSGSIDRHASSCGPTRSSASQARPRHR